MTRAGMLSLLQAAVQRGHLHPDRFTGKEPGAQLDGMVERVRVRVLREARGLPLADVLPPETCYGCREEIKSKGKGKKKEDMARGVALRGEYVLVHKEGCEVAHV